MINQEIIDKLSLFNKNTPIGEVVSEIANVNFDSEEKLKYKKIIEQTEKEKTNTPFLSVITRTQGNRPEALRELLMCLNAQTDMNFEVVLIGHKINSDKEELIKEIISEQAEEIQGKIRFILVDEGNRTTPLNYGFALAYGKYVSILDDDDLIFDDWVENFYNGGKKADGRIIRAYSFTQEWESLSDENIVNGLRAVKVPKPTYCNKFDLIEQVNSNKCPTMSLAFPSYIFKKVGIMFDESLTTTEDWDFLMRSVFLSGLYDTENPTSIYRLWVNSDNSHVEHDDIEWLDNHYNIQKKFSEMPVILPIGTIKPILHVLNDYEILKKSLSDNKDNNIDISDNEYLHIDEQIFMSDGQRVLVKPKLYLDFGHGMSEEDTLFGGLEFDKNGFTSWFNLKKVENSISAFRIDISDDSFFVLKSFEIEVIYRNGNKETITVDKVLHNGFVIEEGLAYIKPDPQLYYKLKENECIDWITIKATLCNCKIENVFNKLLIKNSASRETTIMDKIKKFLRKN